MNNRLSVLTLLALLSACTAVKVVTHHTDADPAAAPAGRYHLDEHHWAIAFDVDHLSFSRYLMRFDRAAGELDFNPQDPERSHVAIAVDANSFDSNSEELDGLVKGSAMLDVEHFPEIKFQSRVLRRIDKSSGEMTGDLTIHGQTRPVTLQVAFNGGARNPLTGEDTLGFSATGSISRGAYGLSQWFPAVGDSIEIRIEAEFAKSSSPK